MTNKSSRTPLTRDSILQAAMHVADAKGLDALSMRQLGRELGVEGMALYHHYKNKEQLMEALLNAVHAEIVTPETPDWREAMRSRATSVLETLEHHPWASTIMESGPQPGTATMQDREAMARCFRQAGFSIETTVHAMTLLDIYIYGAAQQYVKLSISNAKEAAAVSQGVIDAFPANIYPYFSEILTTHIFVGKYNPKDEFYFGLDILLESIAQLNDFTK